MENSETGGLDRKTRKSRRGKCFMDKETNAQNTGHPLISIIVPVFKVEKYLRKCVDSILAQTYHDYELILVDDGSPDHCGKICDQYAMNHPTVHVLHQANQGQAAARNNAVKISKGQFIVFVDSDDYVEPDYLEYLITLQKKYHSDIAVGGFSYLYEGNEPKENKAIIKDELLDPCEALIRMNYTRGLGATLWVKSFKRELIVNHPLPEGRVYEDLAVMYRIIGDSNSVAIGNKKIYYWLQREGSTMHMKFNERQLEAMDDVTALVQYAQNRYPAALASAKYRYAAKAIELMAVLFNSTGGKTYFRELRKHVKRYGKDLLRDHHAKWTMKARVIAAELGYYPAKIIFALHERAKKTFA